LFFFILHAEIGNTMQLYSDVLILFKPYLEYM